MGLWALRYFFRPIGGAQTISGYPLVQPCAGTFERYTDCVDAFARQKAVNRKMALLFGFFGAMIS